ncbi:MAG: phosphate regulon sensor protein PhoR [Gammaproteobacteria bacterium]|nr:phosphate regulon sensor protein PhoR [Gammaproteobacteria bacterium]
MGKLWSSEFPAILTTLFVMVLLGIILNNWFLAAFIALSSFIGWIYFRMIKLEKWLARGAKTSEVYDDNGFMGYIISHLYKQKKTHIRRKKRTKEILRRLNQNISALPDATVLLNDSLEIEWANEPAHYLLGIHRRYDIGLRISSLIRHPAFLSYLISPDKKKRLEIESPVDGKITLQIKIVRFGRDQRLLTARNISDAKQLQESLKNFVANASHELKTPLTVIAGHLEMLENEKALSKTGKKSLKVAQKQSKRMQTLIQDLLLLSQVESYQLQTTEGNDLYIPEIMANVMSAVDRDCEDENITCTIPDNLFLLGIKNEIEGICINLIDNALKYSPEKTPIEVLWNINSEGECIFSVKDKGPGIAEEEIEHLTERYYRGQQDGTEQTLGSGLGLAIVQHAAIKHGGVLNIRSQLNKGSTFSVTFPSYRVIKNKPQKNNVVKLQNYSN